jgi:hypothetical protein
MADNFAGAGSFFNRALAAQQSAAAGQRDSDRGYADDAERNPFSQSLHIGAVPPDVNQVSEEDSPQSNFLSDVKEDLLSRAQQKRRPTDGEPAYRAGGGINYAVKR